MYVYIGMCMYICVYICMCVWIYIYLPKKYGGLDMMQTITLEATFFPQYLIHPPKKIKIHLKKDLSLWFKESHRGFSQELWGFVMVKMLPSYLSPPFLSLCLLADGQTIPCPLTSRGEV